MYKSITSLAMLITLFVAMGRHAQAQTPRLIGMGEDNDSITFDSIANMGLMVLDITTVDHEWPTCDYVSAPAGAWGASITNVTKVPGRLRLWRNGEVAFDTGDYVPYSKGMTIRIRGNTSAYNFKKPYKIDLQDKGDLLLRNNPSYRDKDWILLNDPIHTTLQGLELNRYLGMAWTPAYRYVNVIINDEYQGYYMLIESVKRASSRINIDKRGALFELDAYWWNADYYVESMLHSTAKYTFKHPDPDDMTTADKAYVEQLVADYEASVLDGTYDQVIDVDAFARWSLGRDILETTDAAGANKYLVRYDRSPQSLITIPLMWDFTSSEGSEVGWSACHSYHASRLFKSDNKAFVLAYVSKWEQVRENIVADMSRIIDRFRLSDEGMALMRSSTIENTRWHAFRTPWSSLNKRAEWFGRRWTWLDEAITALIRRGDINIDGRVDVLDINQAIDIILELRPGQRQADVNGDGNVDILDVNEVIGIILADTPIEPLPPITLSPDSLAFDAEGGTEVVLIDADAPWAIVPATLPQWLEVSSLQGDVGTHEVVFAAAPTTTTRDAEVAVVCGNYTATLRVVQTANDISEITCIADFIAADFLGDEPCQLGGVVTIVDSLALGRLALTDWSATVWVSGMESMPEFADIKPGDIIDVTGQRVFDGDQTQLAAQQIDAVKPVNIVTIEQLKSLPLGTLCMVTATISKILNDETGAMELADADGHRLRLAACAPGYGATGEQACWLVYTMNLAEGDEITVIGKSAHGLNAEMLNNAFFYSKSTQPTINTPEQ